MRGMCRCFQYGGVSFVDNVTHMLTLDATYGSRHSKLTKPEFGRSMIFGRPMRKHNLLAGHMWVPKIRDASAIAAGQVP